MHKHFRFNKEMAPDNRAQRIILTFTAFVTHKLSPPETSVFVLSFSGDVQFCAGNTVNTLHRVEHVRHSFDYLKVVISILKLDDVATQTHRQLAEALHVSQKNNQMTFSSNGHDQ